MSWIAVAVVGGAVVGSVASAYSANKSSGAITDAANKSNNTQLMIYNDQMRRWEPYEKLGTDALPKLKIFDETNPLASYEDTVSKSMEGWDYESSPAYVAKKTLAQQELNNQLNARGLNTGGMSAIRSADMTRRLVSADYDKERE
jgi:hypothetical protein